MNKTNISDFLSSIKKNKNQISKDTSAYIDADFSRFLTSSRLALHWITLKPHSKTSYPHAESHEEEFVYVHKGYPHAWINGFLYSLQPGDALGFPAGTGIAHCLINNSHEEIELIVLGELSKKENKCSFPINPELKSKYEKIWWGDFPVQNFGPHNAEIGNISHQKDRSECPFLLNVYQIKRKASYTYPGDKEKFTEGLRLSNLISLKTLGVWHEKLMPGKRTSWPHAHLKEEEAAIILKGYPKAWINGYLISLQPGDGIVFKAGTGIAHTLINDSQEEIEFIGVGEINATDDKVFYPINDSRNEQCQESGLFWKPNSIAFPLGKQSAIPNDPNLVIESVDEAKTFLYLASSYLYTEEATNSLLIGLTEIKLNQAKDTYQYWIIYLNSVVVGAAVMTEKSLLLTSIPATYLKSLTTKVIEKIKLFNNSDKLKLDVVGPSFTAEAFSRVWCELNPDYQFNLLMGQKIYKLTTVKKPSLKLEKNFTFKIAESKNQQIVSEFLYNFCKESLPTEDNRIEDIQKVVTKKIEKKEIFILTDENDSPVSMNYVGRATKNGISVSGVYTPKKWRKKGFASHLVSLTSQYMLDQGKKFCVLYTDIENKTSNKIYQNIGYELIDSSKHFKIKLIDT